VRTITYAEAINEGLYQALENDERAFLIGQGVTSPWYVGSTTQGLLDHFGLKRVLDTPVSENTVTGAAVGAALVGLHPIVVHPRMDFMYYAMDQITNAAASWHGMFGGRVNVPITFWAIVNRGGEQGAQHSQALQALFTHIAGLKVVMPSNPYDAKGLLLASVNDENPVVFIDDRWLYSQQCDVAQDPYTVPIGQGVIRKKGNDVTLVATSYMVQEAIRANETLVIDGIDVEIIDPRTIKPLDEKLLLESVRKTGRLVIADGGWKTCGVAAEVSAVVAEQAFEALKAPIIRITLPDAPAPASRLLENAYYPNADNIVSAIKAILRHW